MAVSGEWRPETGSLDELRNEWAAGQWKSYVQPILAILCPERKGRDGPNVPRGDGGENWLGLVVFVFALEKRVGTQRGGL